MDDRNALLMDLQQKRERLQGQAQRGRETRDRLNDETKRHSQRRDELNAQVRGIVERANQHKAKRDELNRRVHETKAKRDELNKEAHAKSEVLQGLRREKGAAQGPPGVPIGKLKAEIKHLEYQHQTTVLTPQKEKALIELIGAKLKELKEREASFQESAEIKTAYEAMRVAKSAAEEQHAAVTLAANEAQAEHDTMVKLFDEADGLRKQADAAQADFVKNKVEADRVHREYIEAVGALRDIERVMYALRSAGGHQRGERDSPSHAQASAGSQAQAEADEIFSKFRKGEKLSTEDLMALQKAGRL